ncbi:MAG TPA: hypothetical protein DEX10_04350 [Betaproteobacteria bacterium]|nr:hypothetical protein [Betaproteobacteria bacterium]
MKSPIQLFVALAILLATATVTAQVYKWVDKDGKVLYTDIPPPADGKGAAKKLEIKSGSGKTEAPTPKADAAKKSNDKDAAKSPPGKPLTLEERNKESEKRRAEQAEAEKKAAEQAKIDKANQERCKEATRYMRDLETGRPISTTDDAGERKLLDDNTRAAERTRTRNVMNESCK